MIACPSCGLESPDEFGFCPRCGAQLTSPVSLPEERKVVTSLFCDLVGFTALSEGADPEDVDRLLRSYNALARRIVESYGGVVEKFVGDAVFAVFGVPVVHEDDPERAVRAGLKIVERIGGLRGIADKPVRVRIGINTGEALVNLHVAPTSGEGFLTGDAVNVAARLQAVAPPMGVVVGESTHALTSRVIVYEELETVALKGKSAPVRAWWAKSTRARTGARGAGDFSTPLIGRERELATLTRLLDEAVGASTSRFLLLVGEPGIGKTRLVAEFANRLDERPQLVTWRQGRCLPYGEGVAFWPLAEIVKAQAGVFDSDDAETAEAKLQRALPDDGDRAWLANRLRPLLGLETDQASREENFLAWRQFLTSLAAGGPAVLVLEDLHWADEVMLAFLEYLVSHNGETPLLVVATARPTLFERAPDFAADSAVERLVLDPFSAKETGRLVAALLGTDSLSDDMIPLILARCGGNPLYTEELTRLLRDRGLVRETDEGLTLSAAAELPLPGSLQGVIAARLDALSPEAKALLCDAAVVGEVFWTGALVTIGERESARVRRVLADLAAGGLVFAKKPSTMAGEEEYAFRHVLTRDVAYGELPRAARATRHKAAGSWLEEKAGDRTEDLADVLAYHYKTALELARTVDDEGLAASLVGLAVRYLSLAGDRALLLDAAAAERHWAQALGLVGADDAQRPWLLGRYATALVMVGRTEEAIPAFDEAVAGLQALGEARKAAYVLTSLMSLLQDMGRREAEDCCRQALALLEGDEPSREQVWVLYNACVFHSLERDARLAGDLGRRAFDTATRLGLSEQTTERGFNMYRGALMARGLSRCRLGDAGGLEDLRRVSEAERSAGYTGPFTLNYAAFLAMIEGPRRAIEVHESARDEILRYGRRTSALQADSAVFELLCVSGGWERALGEAMGLVDQLLEIGHLADLCTVQTWRAAVLVRRGENGPVPHILDAVLQARREIQVPGPVILSAHVAMAYARGLLPADGDTLERAFEGVGGLPCFYEIFLLPDVIRAAKDVGSERLLRSLHEWIEPVLPVHRQTAAYAAALLTELRGSYGEAAAALAAVAGSWHDLGVPYEEAQALLGQGRCLLALGRGRQAAHALGKARTILDRLRAVRASTEAERLLDALAPRG